MHTSSYNISRRSTLRASMHNSTQFSTTYSREYIICILSSYIILCIHTSCTSVCMYFNMAAPTEDSSSRISSLYYSSTSSYTLRSYAILLLQYSTSSQYAYYQLVVLQQLLLLEQYEYIVASSQEAIFAESYQLGVQQEYPEYELDYEFLSTSSYVILSRTACTIGVNNILQNYESSNIMFV